MGFQPFPEGEQFLLEYNDFEIYWDGHATVRIVDEGFTVVVDPFEKVSDCEEADLVLVTHGDAGHFDTNALEKVCKDGTCVVAPEALEEKDIPCNDTEFISEDEEIDIFGIHIEAVPMRNSLRDHGEGHGYRFTMRDNSFYVAADTGLSDEAFDLEGKVDVAFLPVDGVYTMDVEDAVKTAVRIKPEVTVPYHFGKPFFSENDVDLRGLKAELEDRNIRCEVLEAESST